MRLVCTVLGIAALVPAIAGCSTSERSGAGDARSAHDMIAANVGAGESLAQAEVTSSETRSVELRSAVSVESPAEGTSSTMQLAPFEAREAKRDPPQRTIRHRDWHHHR
jgi:hypothetical protein